MVQYIAGSPGTIRPQPIILVRGFGGLNVEDEKKIAYQGFNDGTVYPQKRGENYIYEGMVLRFLKSDWRYQDATNIVGYYPRPVQQDLDAIGKLEAQGLRKEYFIGQVVIDTAMAMGLIEASRQAAPSSATGDAAAGDDALKTLWVFRYYDLDQRSIRTYGQELVRLIDFVRALTALQSGRPEPPKVNIIAHSMGGLIVREAVQREFPRRMEAGEPGAETADTCINKIVTLGTPHRGIAFQLLRDWIGIAAADEVNHFVRDFDDQSPVPAGQTDQVSWRRFHEFFPLDRLLTVVGTNYRTYAAWSATLANRLFSAPGEYGANYNRSDGLVKQISAQIPGAPRTFVHKCHGGFDSLVTARESFEIATRFFTGNIKARLSMVSGEVTRGFDLIGKSEFFLGVSIKPRAVDFDLFCQRADAENCYGPFTTARFEDQKDLAFPWADGNDGERLVWEGYLDTQRKRKEDMVVRLDFYVGERDMWGLGFSDNVVFHRQYYVRALLQDPVELRWHADERFDEPGQPIERDDGGWTFAVGSTEAGFKGTFRIELSWLTA